MISITPHGLKSFNKAITDVARKVHLHTDSQYVQKGISEWVLSWKTRNWLTANKKPVKNDDLWKSLDQLVQQHEVEWFWVRGHSGHDGNERADELANRCVDEIATKI